MGSPSTRRKPQKGLFLSSFPGSCQDAYGQIKPDVRLLFDEAEALFSKGTDVTVRHDRYGNRDVNDLLKRMENDRSLVILATNGKRLIDKAFLPRPPLTPSQQRPSL